MKRFKKILVYAGGEVAPDAAIERAAALAQENRALLTLVDVLPESSERPWINLPELPAGRLDELNELALPLARRGIATRTKILTGNPFVELIREVLREEHDLVMKTAQGLSGRLGGLLGSTALHLMRKCPCPVWVLKPGHDESRKGVLAAVCPDPLDPGKDAASTLLLELAASLARSKSTELHIVHAWWLWEESMLRGRRMNMSPETVDGILEKEREAAAAVLERALQTVDLTGVKYQAHLIKGMPFEVIARFAERVDVTVMGTLSRTGLAGVLIGNTAEQVLHQIDCSVLTVKSPGFETPIRLPVERSELSA